MQWQEEQESRIKKGQSKLVRKLIYQNIPQVTLS